MKTLLTVNTQIVAGGDVNYLVRVNDESNALVFQAPSEASAKAICEAVEIIANCGSDQAVNYTMNHLRQWAVK